MESIVLFNFVWNHVATYMDKDFTEQELEMYSSNIYNLWVPAQNDPRSFREFFEEYSIIYWEPVLCILVAPISEASSERSGSKQRLVLTHLRTSTGNISFDTDIQMNSEVEGKKMDELFRLSPEAIVYQNLLNFLHYELHFITYLFILFSYV